MLFPGRIGKGINRREFLQVGGSTALGLTLADLLRLKAQNPTPNATGSARAVIMVRLIPSLPHSIVKQISAHSQTLILVSLVDSLGEPYFHHAIGVSYSRIPLVA